VRPNTCGGCDAEWHGTRVAHCAARNCHRTFAGVGLFDAHRTVDGRCLDPAEMRTRAGDRRMWFRDGMWRGPEATAEQLAALSAWRGVAS
jgi:hypothetical protein